MKNRAPLVLGMLLHFSLLCSGVASHAIETYLDPQVANQFKNGDTATRQKIIRELFEGKKLLEMDDSYLAAFIVGADDADQGVRHTSVALIGERWIWKGGEQEPQAIEFLLQRTHSDEAQMRYDCVYYGLSAMRPMSDAVIDRLIELAVEIDRQKPKSLFGRVLWGFRSNPDRAAARIQAYLDRHDGKDSATAIRAMNLYMELTKRVPLRLEKFADTGEYAMLISPKPPFLPKTVEEVEQKIRSYVNDPEAIHKLKVILRNGKFYSYMYVGGLPLYSRLQADLQNSGLFEFTPYGLTNPEMAAFLNEAFQQDEFTKDVTYPRAFVELYELLEQQYPCFELKEIDWQAVGEELLPQSVDLRTQDEFSMLCLQLIARLEDSHAQLLKGTAQPAAPSLPRWDTGFACLIDNEGKPVVYYVGKNTPAEAAGVQIGMTIEMLNGQPAAEAIESCMQQYSKYFGFSSKRLLQYQSARWFARQTRKGDSVKITAQDSLGESHKFEIPAMYKAGYLPRLPVPIEGIADSKDVSWKRLDGNIGYLYVRRIRAGLIADLDRAIADLKGCRGLILDVRGNSGGGFDSKRAFRNFDLESEDEPERPRFDGPMAVLIDARCISAGEGWVSWFFANRRAQFFGETTAGASARKKTVDVCGGLFRVRFPVKAYRGFLDRPIERLGIEPHVSVIQNANDLVKQTDTVLETARTHLQSFGIED